MPKYLSSHIKQNLFLQPFMLHTSLLITLPLMPFSAHSQAKTGAQQHATHDKSQNISTHRHPKQPVNQEHDPTLSSTVGLHAELFNVQCCTPQLALALVCFSTS